MPFYGSIVVIRRTGLDGSIFPLVSSECLLGRGEHCDIRVQLPTVSGEHCKITINNSDQALLTCSSKDFGQTQLNNKSVPFQGILVLNHKDVFTIGDRKFRWEYPDDSPHLVVSTPKKKSSKSPVKVNGGNGNGNGVSGKGETYATMTPKAMAKAAAEAKADTPAHVSHSKRVSFGPYVSPEYIDKNLPPSTPVKKGATPKVSEVNVRDISVIESTPANLLKKSLLRKAMEGVEEEKDAQFSSEAGLLKSHEPPLVEDYILEPRTSQRVSPMAATEALKTSPLAKAPETPKSTKTIVETPTTAKKETPKKTPPRMSWSAKGLTPSPKSSEKTTPAKAATKVATPKKTPAKVLVTPRRSLGRKETPKLVQKATPAKKTPAKAATPKVATKVATPKKSPAKATDRKSVV